MLKTGKAKFTKYKWDDMVTTPVPIIPIQHDLYKNYKVEKMPTEYRIPPDLMDWVLKAREQFAYYERVHAEKGTITGYSKAAKNCEFKNNADHLVTKYAEDVYAGELRVTRDEE